MGTKVRTFADGKAIEFDCPDCGRTIRTHAHNGAGPCSECQMERHGVPRATSHKQWQEHYRQWEEDALKECHDGTGGVVDEAPVDGLELCANGQVHILGTMIITERGYVTPWEESEHFILHFNPA